MDSAEKYNVGHGFYYSVVVNNFLNVQNAEVVTSALLLGQVEITNSTYNQIVLDQLTDLWTNYGNLTEAISPKLKMVEFLLIQDSHWIDLV